MIKIFRLRITALQKVNHCFTCVIKIKSRNKLTVAEDDRHQREKQQSKIHFISLKKRMK